MDHNPIKRVGAMLILSVSLMAPQQGQQPVTPGSIVGTWKIQRFEEVGSHAFETIDFAQKQIGKKITLHRKAFEYDNNFLWFTPKRCSRANYRVEMQRLKEYDMAQKGTLAFYGLQEARKTEILRVVLFCDCRAAYSLELDKENHLAIYYDGWFFFLLRVRPA